MCLVVDDKCSGTGVGINGANAGFGENNANSIYANRIARRMAC